MRKKKIIIMQKKNYNKETTNIKTITCPYCDSKECFVETIDEEQNINVYLCKNCGMTSSTFYSKNNSNIKKFINVMPRLVQDKKFFDKERQLWWFLAIIQKPDYYVIPEPIESQKDDWQWTVIPVASKKDKNNKKQQFLDIKNSKTFNKNNFSDVLKEVGLSPK